MNEPQYSAPPPARNPRSFRSLLTIVGLAFVAGIAVMGWGLSRWDMGRQWLFGAPEAEKLPAITFAPSQPTVASPPVVAPVPVPDIAARLATLEGRVAKVEASGGIGSGESARAEGLLVSFAARRALDRGLGLGYVEGLLTQRFGETQPRAVAMVIAASKQASTLEQLKGGLDSVAPDLIGGGPDEGWWDGFKRGASSLFVVREAGTVSSDPAARVARAGHLIESGRVDLALAEISRLPTRDRAAAWMAMARRHVEAHRALDILEAAAITAGDPPAAPAPKAPPRPDTGETL